MEGIKYENLINIGPVATDMYIVVPVNNTYVLHIFLSHWHVTMCPDRIAYS